MSARKGYYARVREIDDVLTAVHTHLYVDGLLVSAALAIDAVAEKFKTTALAYYRIGGVQYSKAAATAIVFTAAHVVAASKYGAILVQVNAAGTVSTKVGEATPTTTMSYDTSAAAIAALPTADANNIALGYIVIANNAGTWTANTDDMTAASDVTTATFTNTTVKTVPTALED